MTTYFVDDGGSDTSPYDTWVKAANALQTVLSIASAGDIVKVEKTHNETSSAADLNLTAISENPGVEIVRVDSSDSDSYAPTGGSSNFTTDTGAYQIHPKSSGNYYGVHFDSNEHIALNNDDDGFSKFIDCDFTIGVADRVSLNKGFQEMRGCVIDTHDSGATFAAPIIVSQTGTTCRIVNTTFTGNVSHRSNVTELWYPGHVEYIGCDLSGFTTNPTGLLYSSAFGMVKYVDCKLPPNYSLGAIGDRAARIEVIRCDGTDDYQVASGEGDLVSEGTIIRTGGAAKSWECTTKAEAGATSPFYTPWIYAVADAAESKNFDIHFAYSGSQLTEEEIFMELEVMDSAATPYGVMITSQKKAILGDAVGNPNTATETWGGSETYEEYLRITETVGVANSVVRARIGIEKSSQSDEIYIDPYLEIS